MNDLVHVKDFNVIAPEKVVNRKIYKTRSIFNFSDDTYFIINADKASTICVSGFDGCACAIYLHTAILCRFGKSYFCGGRGLNATQINELIEKNYLIPYNK